MRDRSSQPIEFYREQISAKISWDDDLEQALELAYHARKPEKCRPRALDAVLRLIEFDVDKHTIVATLVSDMGLKDSFSKEQIKSRYGSQVLALAQGIHTINSFQDCNEHSFRTPQQAEKLRRLLLAIIKDVRVMLVKLCYRVSRMQLL